jgi:flagellar biosynthesis/type III secretory pathway protein FliH
MSTDNISRVSPYTTQWWYSDEGQRIARIMMDMIEYNGNGEKVFSNDFVVMVAKMAYEAGKRDGYAAGYAAGYQECRQRIIDSI